jgi:hypothetical protein
MPNNLLKTENISNNESFETLKQNKTLKYVGYGLHGRRLLKTTLTQINIA